MKNRLREIFKLKREYYTPGISEIDGVNANLQSLLSFMNFQYVMAYSPLVGEVDIQQTNRWILNSKTLYLPKVAGEKLDVYEIENLENDLEKGSFKILEPKDSCKKSNRGSLHAIVVPGVCFDENGYRLGFGRGYYDKFLEGFLGAKIGVCFEEFLTSDIYPEKHDIQMDFVVTEKSIYAQKKN